jgi:hypothetical protein
MFCGIMNHYEFGSLLCESLLFGHYGFLHCTSCHDSIVDWPVDDVIEITTLILRVRPPTVAVENIVANPADGTFCVTMIFALFRATASV